jgi:hypothetical protein
VRYGFLYVRQKKRMKQAKAAAGITGSSGRHGAVGEIIPGIMSRFVRRTSEKAIVSERPRLQGTWLDAFVQEGAVDVSGGDVSGIERDRMLRSS